MPGAGVAIDVCRIQHAAYKLSRAVCNDGGVRGRGGRGEKKDGMEIGRRHDGTAARTYIGDGWPWRKLMGRKKGCMAVGCWWEGWGASADAAQPTTLHQPTKEIQVGQSSGGFIYFFETGDGDPASPLQRYNSQKQNNSRTPSSDQSYTKAQYPEQRRGIHKSTTPSRDNCCTRRHHTLRYITDIEAETTAVHGATTPCGTSRLQEQRQVGATSFHLLKSKRERLCCAWFTCCLRRSK